MATEYRELNAVIKAIWSVKISPDAEIFNALKRAIEEEVKNIEHADVRPAVRGKWTWTDDMYETRQCSVCGYDTQDYIEYHFCPNCGADMRSERRFDE